MSANGVLQEARAAFARRDWVAARAAFSAAGEQADLEADDLYALAGCAWWLGDLDAALPAQQEAYRRYLEAEQPARAAFVALDTGYTLALRGDAAQSSGWTGRAVRLLDSLPEGIEHGYLHYIEFERAFYAFDLEVAIDRGRAVDALAHRFRDATLMALGVLAEGRLLLKRGEVGEGMALLDEAMVAAVSDELQPSWAGNIYCHLMEACDEVADLRRAGEWTQATARWCEQMPGAGPFMGICRVHRAHVLAVRGAWDEAEREVLHVCEELAHFDVALVGEARYQLGELRRRRGDLRGADEAFRAGHRLGRDPQPGLALLRLASGQPAAAMTSIRAALAAAGDDVLARARLLPAAVEIAVAVGALDRAREASDELARTASTYATPGFIAQSRHAHGMLLLADGDVARALAVLRDALRCWQQLGAPYETARVRMLLARAHERTGAADAATLEREAAQAELVRLGAPRAVDPPAPRPSARPDGLTPREAEVLDLVAAGRSNQEIADALVLSVRTVERHLATVYQKLGVQGRSARAAAVSHALRGDALAPR